MQQTAATHVSKFMNTKACVCEIENHAKVMKKHVFVRVSPIRCRTMEINKKYSQQYIKHLAKLMTNACKIDARKRNAKNIQNDTNMAPKWSSQSIKNK